MRPYLCIVALGLNLCLLLFATASIATNPNSWCQAENDHGVTVNAYCEKSLSLANYFFEKGPLPDFFETSEASHLIDVSQVFLLAKSVFWILFFLTSAYLVWHPGDVKSIFKMVPVFSLVLVIGAVLFPFDALFTSFHKLFFPTGNWTFPANSLLIQLYPFDFFYDLAGKIMARYGLLSSFVGGLGFLRRKIFFK